MPAVLTASERRDGCLTKASRKGSYHTFSIENVHGSPGVDAGKEHDSKDEEEKHHELNGHQSVLKRSSVRVRAWSSLVLSTMKKFINRSTKHHQKSERLASLDSSLSSNWRPLCRGSITEMDISKDYKLGRMIGRGQFGSVYLCTKRATGQQFACKALSKEALYEEEALRLQMEVEVMEKLQGHPNIVQLEAVYEDKRQLCIVMEYCSGGTLTEYILEQGRYSERAAAHVLKKLVGIIKHCHANGVVHRDVKLENLLIASRVEGAEIKAIDFGSSAFYKPGTCLTAMEGSPFFMAPEVMAGSYGPECDIWSAGVCLYVLLCGHPPFSAGSLLETMEEVKRAELDFRFWEWSSVSPEAKALVAAMLSKDPKMRPTAIQLLEHPWVRGDMSKGEEEVSLAAVVLPRLRTFSALSYFHKICLTAVAQRLPSETLSKIRTAFAEVDIDNNGTITTDELAASLDKIGLSQRSRQTAVEFIRSVDLNHTGGIELEEFVAATLRLKLEYMEDGARAVFEKFSGRELGGITRERLAEACREYGVRDPCLVNMMMDEVDTDKDGWISYKEFLAAMKVPQRERLTDTSIGIKCR